MTSDAQTISSFRNPDRRAIAGALDITYAIGSPLCTECHLFAFLQSVASGLLGAPAFNGGFADGGARSRADFCIALSAR